MPMCHITTRLSQLQDYAIPDIHPQEYQSYTSYFSWKS